ncbi:hypothetical protein B0T22DRAFT_426364 [Podospora appendiculata]|uniref:Zn(2)-C6 fungal-type domain-containing protein n=1 Tax=Podospora appendiculata TaxID=314037 RepID=A0AAE0XA38_9PEZI|nr:hypothetical protein B0T22DRAFT_426364 [Podospora appendiculata]
MGRRPNALILQYFERGPKLQDQSNRYPHTCKACGEHFPRGRLDSLTAHLTKKCPAIGEADRVNALFTLSGMGHGTRGLGLGRHNHQAQHQTHAAHAAHAAHVHAAHAAHVQSQAAGPPADLPMMQREMERDWTALGVLAEVSRQIDLNEKNDDRVQPPQPAATAPASLSSPPTSAPHPADRFELQDQPLLHENPEPIDQDHLPNEGKGEWLAALGSLDQRPLSDLYTAEPALPQDIESEPTAEERLQEILRADDAADSANLSMAAAATARLHPLLRLQPDLLDPQILGQEANPAAAEAAEAAGASASPSAGDGHDADAAVVAETAVDTTADTTVPEAVTNSLTPIEANPTEGSPSVSAASPSQPWGEITYATDSFQAMTPSDAMMTTQERTPLLTKGGFRLESAGVNGAKSRHSRARFNATRRKQVQEVRKIGACIRCRVLRKTCSQGEPCDTCRKVLSPRVWRSGCVRTKFSEQLDLYSAGVQIVLAQGRINTLKKAMSISNHGVHIEACHFADQETHLRLQVMQRDGPRDVDGKDDTSLTGDNPIHYPIIMVDNDVQDVPALVETYMREILPELIRREPSNFMQVTLQTALDIASSTNDELLKKSLELWGLVELLDRERQWIISVKIGVEDAPVGHIKDDNQEVFTTICLQLAAAAERKAAATSKSLLTGMQRVLQDSKVKIDFNMYFATLILLNSVEKSTWAFKAWEQANLRTLWPLEKDPESFTRQGYVIANLLRMLLSIRKALPRIVCRETDGKLVAEEEDPTMQGYFESVNLSFDQIKAKQDQPVFSPTDPRSFELLFCSTLLLPTTD